MERYHMFKLGLAILFYAAYCVRPMVNGLRTKKTNITPEDYLVFYQVKDGTPGIDFPNLAYIPKTSFSCQNFESGYYADLDADCQVFHVCDEGRKISFLCPNGTIFQQSELICEWWFKVDCTNSPNLYHESAERLKEDLARRKGLRKAHLDGQERNHGAVFRVEEPLSLGTNKNDKTYGFSPRVANVITSNVNNRINVQVGPGKKLKEDHIQPSGPSSGLVTASSERYIQTRSTTPSSLNRISLSDLRGSVFKNQLTGRRGSAKYQPNYEDHLLLGSTVKPSDEYSLAFPKHKSQIVRERISISGLGPTSSRSTIKIDSSRINLGAPEAIIQKSPADLSKTDLLDRRLETGDSGELQVPQETAAFTKSSYNSIQPDTGKFSTANPYPNHRITYSDLRQPNFPTTNFLGSIKSVTPQYITTQSINNGKPFIGSTVGVSIYGNKFGGSTLAPEANTVTPEFSSTEKSSFESISSTHIPSVTESTSSAGQKTAATLQSTGSITALPPSITVQSGTSAGVQTRGSTLKTAGSITVSPLSITFQESTSAGVQTGGSTLEPAGSTLEPAGSTIYVPPSESGVTTAGQIEASTFQPIAPAIASTSYIPPFEDNTEIVGQTEVFTSQPSTSTLPFLEHSTKRVIDHATVYGSFAKSSVTTPTPPSGIEVKFSNNVDKVSIQLAKSVGADTPKYGSTVIPPLLRPDATVHIGDLGSTVRSATVSTSPQLSHGADSESYIGSTRNPLSATKKTFTGEITSTPSSKDITISAQAIPDSLRGDTGLQIASEPTRTDILSKSKTSVTIGTGKPNIQLAKPVGEEISKYGSTVIPPLSTPDAGVHIGDLEGTVRSVPVSTSPELGHAVDRGSYTGGSRSPLLASNEAFSGGITATPLTEDITISTQAGADSFSLVTGLRTGSVPSGTGISLKSKTPTVISGGEHFDGSSIHLAKPAETERLKYGSTVIPSLLRPNIIENIRDIENTVRSTTVSPSFEVDLGKAYMGSTLGSPDFQTGTETISTLPTVVSGGEYFERTIKPSLDIKFTPNIIVKGAQGTTEPNYGLLESEMGTDTPRKTNIPNLSALGGGGFLKATIRTPVESIHYPSTTGYDQLLSTVDGTTSKSIKDIVKYGSTVVPPLLTSDGFLHVSDFHSTIRPTVELLKTDSDTSFGSKKTTPLSVGSGVDSFDKTTLPSVDVFLNSIGSTLLPQIDAFAKEKTPLTKFPENPQEYRSTVPTPLLITDNLAPIDKLRGTTGASQDLLLTGSRGRTAGPSVITTTSKNLVRSTVLPSAGTQDEETTSAPKLSQGTPKYDSTVIPPLLRSNTFVEIGDLKSSSKPVPTVDPDAIKQTAYVGKSDFGKKIIPSVTSVSGTPLPSLKSFMQGANRGISTEGYPKYGSTVVPPLLTPDAFVRISDFQKVPKPVSDLLPDSGLEGDSSGADKTPTVESSVSQNIIGSTVTSDIQTFAQESRLKPKPIDSTKNDILPEINPFGTKTDSSGSSGFYVTKNSVYQSITPSPFSLLSTVKSLQSTPSVNISPDSESGELKPVDKAESSFNKDSSLSKSESQWPKPFQKSQNILDTVEGSTKSEDVTPTYLNYKISSARPFKLPDITPAPTLPTPFTTASSKLSSAYENVDNMINILKEIVNGTEQDFSSETPRPGLIVPPSAGPQTLHTLAVYFANALDGIAAEREKSTGEELDPESKEKLTNLLTQMTMYRYKELFKGREAPETDEVPTTVATKDILTADESENLIETPALRQLAKNFSLALSSYLDNPEAFRKDLESLRPTEPPALGGDVTEAGIGEEELLNFSDADSKSNFPPVFPTVPSAAPTWGYIIAPKSSDESLDVKNSLNPDLHTADTQSFVPGFNTLAANVKESGKGDVGSKKELPEGHWTASPGATKLWQSTFSINPAVVNEQFVPTEPSLPETSKYYPSSPSTPVSHDIPHTEIQYDLRSLPRISVNSTQVHGILIDFVNATKSDESNRLQRLLRKLNTTEDEFLNRMKEIESNPLTRRLILLLISECGANATKDYEEESIPGLTTHVLAPPKSSSAEVSSSQGRHSANSGIPELVDHSLQEDDQDTRALQLLNSLYTIAAKFGK